MVHRDLKPANIFLTLEGTAKLFDFGVAKPTSSAASIGADRPDQTKSLTLFGTPEYMAPEQATSGPVDGRADLYALGCVLYEMLTGRLPFAGKSAVAILEAKTKGSPESPRERAPNRGIPKSVDELVMRAIARHPSLRFQSAAEMITAITAGLEEPNARRSSRRVMGYAALAAVMGFATVLLVGKSRELRSMIHLDRTPPPALAAAVEPPALAAAVEPPALAAATVASVTDAGAVDPGVRGDVVLNVPDVVLAANDAAPTAALDTEARAPDDAREDDAVNAEAPAAPSPVAQASSVRRTTRKHAPATPALKTARAIGSAKGKATANTVAAHGDAAASAKRKHAAKSHKHKPAKH